MVNRLTSDRSTEQYRELLDYIQKYDDYESAWKAHESHDTKDDNKKNKDKTAYFNLKIGQTKKYKEDEGKNKLINNLNTSIKSRIKSLKKRKDDEKETIIKTKRINENSDDEKDININNKDTKLSVSNTKIINNKNSTFINDNKNQLNDEENSSERIKKDYNGEDYLKDDVDNSHRKDFEEEENEEGELRKQEISLATQRLEKWCCAFAQDCLKSANNGLAQEGLKLLDQLFNFEQQKLKDVENINGYKTKIFSKKKSNIKNINNIIKDKKNIKDIINDYKNLNLTEISKNSYRTNNNNNNYLNNNGKPENEGVDVTKLFCDIPTVFTSFNDDVLLPPPKFPP